MTTLSAISCVMKHVATQGVAKDRRNTSQGYYYRGIDDMMNVLSTCLHEQGLVIWPEVLDRSERQVKSSSGGILNYVTLRVRYTLCVDSGTPVEVVVFGEAMDASDKATNKAMSAAYKYMAIQVFCIPVVGDDSDADAHSPEPVYAPQQNTTDNAFARLSERLRNATDTMILQEVVAVADQLPKRDRDRLRPIYVEAKQRLEGQ